MEPQEAVAVAARLPEMGQLAAAALIVVGVAPLLLARKLVRPAMALIGLAGGGFAMLIVPPMVVEAQVMPLLIAGGAVAGCLAGWLLFRPCVALGCAVLLALALPLGMLAREGKLPPLAPVAERTVAADAEAQAAPPAQELVTDPLEVTPWPLAMMKHPAVAAPAPALAAASMMQLPALPAPAEVVAPARDWSTRLQTLGHDWRAWWSELGAGTQRRLVSWFCGGALIGLLLGLIAPNLGVATLGGVLGSALVLVGASAWLAQAGVNSVWLEPAHLVLSGGLITLGSVAVQWIVWGRRADR